MKETLELLQKDVAQLTQQMAEKAAKGQDVDVKELSDKVAALQKELTQERKRVAVDASGSDQNSKELGTRLDELYIAKALCTDVDTGKFDNAAFQKIAKMDAYVDAVKAFGDVDAVTTTGDPSAKDFIPKGFSKQLQNEIWLALEVAGLFPRMAMPHSDYTLPFNPGRIVARAAAEGGTVTKDKPPASKITFNAKKIMSIVEMTDEFEQDSIVPALNFLRQQLIDGFALAQETMCINGDTSTGIYANALTGDDARKLVKGIRTDAMGTGTKLSGATGDGLSITNLRALRALMGKYGKRPSDLAIIVSMADYNKMLTFDGYQYLYSYGAGAVILNGELGRFDGIPIIVSELLPSAGVATDAPDALGGLNTDGKFDGSTYTKGTAVIVNRHGYSWGDRAEFSLELWRNPLYQTTNLIGAQRLDFQKVAAANAKTTGVLYNY